MSSLEGKVAIVTGGNTGVGFETAVGLAALGAHVILACRNKSKAINATQQICSRVENAKVEFILLDLMRLKSVEEFVVEFKKRSLPLHILVCNAGVGTGLSKAITKDGLNCVFGVNYLSHFYLVELLLPKMIHSAPARIITLGSIRHRAGNGRFNDAAFGKIGGVYPESKLAMVMLAYELQRRYAEKGVTACAVNPGSVNSEIWRYVPKWVECFFAPFRRCVFLTSKQGAQPSIIASTDFQRKTSQQLEYFTPYWMPTKALFYKFPFSLFSLVCEAIGPFVGCQKAPSSLTSYDKKLARKLWTISEIMVSNIVAERRTKQ